MGTITKAVDGGLTVNFNKAQLVALDEEIFKYGVASFAYLVPRNKTIFLTDFIALIRQHYEGDPRVEAVVKIIEKAKITKKFRCEYSFFDGEKIVRQAAVVDAESWHQLGELVERNVGSKITGLEIGAGSYSYKRGVLSYKPYRSGVVSHA